ncbi:hypothetical protein [Occallatibacter riparius]|uniref:Uncharacterized protein n=1 Tax=Occallatibacter riparius TaxID=1002689 RepID=A0A9J7BQW0_9BACT|nr:hypothetical protein [Occallatibacter riparius]UWZ83477.1 hypothetical protein MOP44_23290 [Occallatibacter riparius]
MGERELFILSKVILTNVEDVHDGKRTDGDVALLKRIRNAAQQYENAAASLRDDSPPRMQVTFPL